VNWRECNNIEISLIRIRFCRIELRSGQGLKPQRLWFGSEEISEKQISDVLLRPHVWLIDIALLIAPDFTVCITGWLRNMLHAKAIQMIAAIGSCDFRRDVSHLKLEDYAICSTIAIATIRLKGVSRLAILSAVNRVSVCFIELEAN